jgi:hypothetical protein
MRKCRVAASDTTTADPSTVYALLRDGSTWPAWSTIESFRLEREGDGEVRVFVNGRITGRDEITGFTPDRSFSYAHTSSLPVRDYTGRIELIPAEGGGTAIHWQVSFLPKVPGTGWLLRRALTPFITGLVHGLAGHAAGR